MLFLAASVDRLSYHFRRQGGRGPLGELRQSLLCVKRAGGTMLTAAEAAATTTYVLKVACQPTSDTSTALGRLSRVNPTSS